MIQRRLVREGTGEVLGRVLDSRPGAILVRMSSGREVWISDRRLRKGLLDFTFKIYETDVDVVRDAIRYARKSATDPREASYLRKALLNVLEELWDRGVILP